MKLTFKEYLSSIFFTAVIVVGIYFLITSTDSYQEAKKIYREELKSEELKSLERGCYEI